MALRRRLDRDPAAAVTVTADLTRVVYRLVYAAGVRRRGGLLATGEAVAGLELSLLPAPTEHEVAEPLAMLAAAQVPDDPDGLGALHQALVGSRPEWDGDSLRLRGDADARKVAGSYFTPSPLIEHLLDLALEPTLDEAEAETPHGAVERLLGLSVCDPACGSGLFLLGAARRIAARVALRRVTRRGAAREPSQEQLHTARCEVVARCLHGVDLDPGAVELARVCLWLELVRPGMPAPRPVVSLRTGDALLGAPLHITGREEADAWCASYVGPDSGHRPVHWHLELPEVFAGGGFDVVLGNPPFLNRLERRTAAPRTTTELHRARSAGVLAAYTDTSAVFLQRAAEWVRPGGRIALVQPASLLSARDAAGVRADLAQRCAMEALWTCDRPVFDASVLTCAPVLRREAAQGPVRRTHGAAFGTVPARAVTIDELRGEWGFLAAAGLGIPEVRLARAAGVLGDVAECAADFRDQYYGLAPYVLEAAQATGLRTAPLITSGLLEPALCSWGRRPTRFHRRTWQAPVVDLDAAERGPALARWSAARRVPKVLVGTQRAVLGAAVDTTGEWLPSVPTITVAAAPERLWHLLAVLLAPPVVALAAATYAGAGLSSRSVKLSARQVAALPLPTVLPAWDAAAVAAQRAQSDPLCREDQLLEVGRLMCAAYSVSDDSVLEWWTARLQRRSSGR